MSDSGEQAIFRPIYDELVEEYSLLLALCARMIDALRGTKVDDNVRHLHECEAFALKLFAHLATILRLSEAPSGTDPAAAYGFVDHSSAMVVTRAALEAYALCAYLFVPDANRNEEELRRAIWSRSRRMGIQSRRSEPRSKQTRRLRLGNQNKGNVYLRQRARRRKALSRSART